MSQQASSAILKPDDLFTDWLSEKEYERSDPKIQAAHQWARQAAIRLREALCSVPFYAKGASAAAKMGDEMDYWLVLQSSEATLVRPPIDCSR